MAKIGRLDGIPRTVENLEVEKKANQMVGYFKTQIISTTTQLNKQIIYEHIAIFQ